LVACRAAQQQTVAKSSTASITDVFRTKASKERRAKKAQELMADVDEEYANMIQQLTPG
jgi:hypothetical protein